MVTCGTWDMTKKRVKGNHKILGASNRSMELPLVEVWKTKGSRFLGEVEFNFRRIKLELLYDIKLIHRVSSWMNEFVVQSRICD